VKYSGDDALDRGAEELLRAWFQWWHNADDVPDHLPEGLHIATAAFLAARAVQDGRKIYSPDSI
jgi:hypothetical protein